MVNVIQGIRLVNNSGGSLNEIVQPIDVKFAFGILDSTGTVCQIIPWVKCKDYLHDVLWAGYNNKGFLCHGLKLNPTEHISAPPKDWLLMVRPGPKLYDVIKDLFPKLDCLMDFIDEYYEYENVLFIKLKPKWISHPACISLLTFYIRSLALTPDLSTLKALYKFLSTHLTTSDLSTLHRIRPEFIEKLVKNCDNFVGKESRTFPSENVNIYNLHGEGVAAYCFYDEEKSTHGGINLL